MATYEEIYGKRVKEFDSDPTLESSYEGQVWYDKSSGTLRTVVSFASFSSSSPVSTARYSAAFGGPQTANFVAAGAPGNIASTEEYNGSGWSAGGNVVQGRDGAIGAGTIPAGLIMGGIYPGTTYVALTEEYDGSSWSEVTNLSQARGYANGSGIQTAAWLAGGRQGPPYSNPSQTEEYDGTSWTSGGALATNTRTGSFSGPQTAAWIVGGKQPDESTINTISQFYDGSTWTNGPSNPTAIHNGSGSGTQTAALSYGNTTPPSPNGATTVFKYDGTSWAVNPATLGTARTGTSKGMGPSGTSAICVAGRNPSASSLTEEFNESINTITAAAWASGTNMPEANYGAGSFGTQTAFVYFGGAPYPALTNATREYDGSAWTTTGNYIGSIKYLSGAGVESAGLGAGGQIPSPGAQTSSAEYDGSSWTSGNSMSQKRMNTGSTMCGTQPAALIVGGDQFPSTPRSLTACEEYDGTNWSTGGVYPTVIQNTAAAGTQTAGWAAGGILDSSPGTVNTFSSSTNEYNGSSWTAGGALPAVVCRAGAAGTDTAGLIFSGTPNGPTNIATTFGYDGSSWSTRPNMATARQSVGAGGVSSPSTAAIGAGGYVTPGTTASTEEFTGETETVTASTLTSS